MVNGIPDAEIGAKLLQTTFDDSLSATRGSHSQKGNVRR